MIFRFATNTRPTLIQNHILYTLLRNTRKTEPRRRETSCSFQYWGSAAGPFALFLLLALSLNIQAQSAARFPLNANALKELELRNIANSSSSGRVADVAVDPRNRSIWYVATAAGGLWKTFNRGLNWQPIFDSGGSYSLGCIAIDPGNPDVVWLGTGENQSQRAIGFGDGVYRSGDSGKTWKYMGLKNSEHIGKIIVDPRNSNVVYVASQGPLWAPGGDRGLYKTTDGGTTWRAILQISENTGISDLSYDPRNPDLLYAASYQRRRHTSILIAGGPESAIFKSTDGGEHWTKLTSGLPKVDTGRIGIAVSPQKPDVVYATVTTSRSNKEGGFFRSEDRGATWSKMSGYMVVDPQYYGEIYPDPHQFDRVYAVDVAIQVTEDGGKTVKPAGWRVHSDNHSITFDPGDANHLLVGNDGGLYESYDAGRTWKHFDNLPVIQFYRVSTDNGLPFYNIYGGTQDNGSQGVPSRTNSRAGIRAADWWMTGGGDGFQSRADQENASIVYHCSQNVNCFRLDLKTGVNTSIHPDFGEENSKLRWRWDIPFIISPHNQKRLYVAGNRLARSDDRGTTWKLISPDLTRQIDRDSIPVMGKTWGPDAVWKHVFTDTFGNGTSLSESPRKEGLLVLGTDDGLIQISEDGGATWRFTGKFPGVPDATYVTSVFSSPHDQNTIFATFNDFQRGNFKPYVCKSQDLGRTWWPIIGNLPDRDPVWTIAQDHVNPNLLFIGTELGLSFSIDGGVRWTRLQSGAAPAAFRDLQIQKRENDLVAATFGRGFYVLDDYSPLRQLTPEVLVKDAELFAAGRKARLYEEIGYLIASGDSAPNPKFGALVTYYLREDQPAEAKTILIISDGEGKVIRQLDVPAKAGIHRAVWDLRTAPPSRSQTPTGDTNAEDGPPAAGRAAQAGRVRLGNLVAPGTYIVTLQKIVNGQAAPLGTPRMLEVVPLEASNR